MTGAAAARPGGERHDHRLADRPARRQDQGCHDPRDRSREDDAHARRQPPSPQSVGGFTERPRHGPHGVLGDRRDERDRQDADGDARREDVEPDACGLIRWTISGLMTAIAKKPSTMLGMPARISRIGLTKLRVRGEAYSARKIALKSPIGVATSMAMADTRNVPMRSVGRSNSPRWGPPRRIQGAEVDCGQEPQRVHDERHHDERADGDRCSPALRRIAARSVRDGGGPRCRATPSAGSPRQSLASSLDRASEVDVQDRANGSGLRAGPTRSLGGGTATSGSSRRCRRWRP